MCGPERFVEIELGIQLLHNSFLYCLLDTPNCLHSKKWVCECIHLVNVCVCVCVCVYSEIRRSFLSSHWWRASLKSSHTADIEYCCWISISLAYHYHTITSAQFVLACTDKVSPHQQIHVLPHLFYGFSIFFSLSTSLCLSPSASHAEPRWQRQSESKAPAGWYRHVLVCTENGSSPQSYVSNHALLKNSGDKNTHAHTSEINKHILSQVLIPLPTP